jgi:hypothetical protein
VFLESETLHRSFGISSRIVPVILRLEANTTLHHLNQVRAPSGVAARFHALVIGLILRTLLTEGSCGLGCLRARRAGRAGTTPGEGRD